MKIKCILFLLLVTSCFIYAENNTTVIVSIEAQRTYVYVNNNLEKTFICSTGLLDNDNNTPLGDFIINESGVKRGEWFFSKKYAEGAKYWVGFIGGVYLFHSVPMDENKKIIEAEAAKLGQPASHGCIRLSVEDAYWFYKNIPDGANLHIVNHFECKQNLSDCKNYKKL